MKLQRVYTAVLLLILNSPFSVFSSTIDADLILQTTDEIRNPSESFKMTVDIQSVDSRSTLEVFIKGKDKTILVTKEPAKDTGRNMLMLDKDFYLYLPNLKRSIRLSLSQKLSGQISNGDIARTRWHGDYKASIRQQTPTEIELFLDAKAEHLTYQKIKLWVATDNYNPLRAEYLSLDGKVVLKTAIFGGYKNMAGKDRPTVISIKDATGATSKILIQKMQSSSFNDSFFSESRLQSLK